MMNPGPYISSLRKANPLFPTWTSKLTSKKAEYESLSSTNIFLLRHSITSSGVWAYTVCAVCGAAPLFLGGQPCSRVQSQVPPTELPPVFPHLPHTPQNIQKWIQYCKNNHTISPFAQTGSQSHNRVAIGQTTLDVVNWSGAG